jgi:hypothetical protein
LALHNYHDSFNSLPLQATFVPGNSFTGYSIHSRLLPYVDQGTVYAQVNYNVGYAGQPDVCKTKVPLFRCPSDIKSEGTRIDAGVEFAGTSYGFSIGTWLAIDQLTGTAGDGPFGVNQKMNFAGISDGQSTTIAGADVKTFTPALLDGGRPVGPNAAVPNTPADVVAYGGTFDPDYCHTQWVAGRTLQSGMTTTFPPNTKVPYVQGGATYDVDFTSARFGPNTNRQSYRVVTSRSHHTGMSHVMFLDGVVRPVSNNIHMPTWRALGTRAGGEVIGDF